MPLAWRFPGGASDNKLYYSDHIQIDTDIPEEFEMLLYDPQTSGGLLMGVPADQIDGFLQAAQSHDCPAWVVGEVIPGDGITVTI